MKLIVDDAVCTGHGRCYRLAPDILSADDEGYVAVRGEPIEFPDAQRELAEEIVGTCPEQAISLIDAVPE
jgi:ferredoxin